jgi:thiol-disulfide isomerase/thioredoxin
MLSVSIGPLALPVAPLLLLAALVLALALLRVIVPRGGAPDAADAASNALWTAAGIGLIGARLGHLLANAEAYAALPWAALDLRDGGWDLPAGLAAGIAWLAWRARRLPALRWPLAIAAATGLLLWGSVSLVLRHLDEARTPALAGLRFESWLDGRTVTLAEAAQGRPAVINLWASWCAPCRAEMPTLANAQQREADIAFLFVNQGERTGIVQAYLQREGLALRGVLLDPARTLGPAAGSTGLPTTLFVDARGRVVHAHLGIINAAALRARVDLLRAAR